MKRYDIRSFYTNENKKQYIIFSTSYISPLKFIDEIEEELSNEIHSEKEIFFDLLLSSGNNKERFGRAIYDGRQFNKKSFSYLSISKQDFLRCFSAKYYEQYNNYVENSILNSIQKKMLCKGICI
ncbi:MAG: hypothetical protein GX962_04900 [Epulopiscium sp.]|nr:hypothetical protein [Candidatus Epulonipiscium sp.]